MNMIPMTASVSIARLFTIVLSVCSPSRLFITITAISNARILKFTMLRFIFSPLEIQIYSSWYHSQFVHSIFFHRDSSRPNSLSLIIKKRSHARSFFGVQFGATGVAFGSSTTSIFVTTLPAIETAMSVYNAFDNGK